MKPNATSDKRAAKEATEILLAVLPRSERDIHNIAYSFGLIAREVAISLDQAIDFITAWSARLREALPDFKERYPLYAKPSQYRYRVCYAVRSAYQRTQEGPAARKFKSLTGKEAPPATFWDRTRPTGTGDRPQKNVRNNSPKRRKL